MRAADSGSAAASSARRASGPFSARSRATSLAHERVRGRRRGQAAYEVADVEARAARHDRQPALGRDPQRKPRRRGARNRRRCIARSMSRISMRLWGSRARRASSGLAVPMSMPPIRLHGIGADHLGLGQAQAPPAPRARRKPRRAGPSCPRPSARRGQRPGR